MFGQFFVEDNLSPDLLPKNWTDLNWKIRPFHGTGTKEEIAAGNDPSIPKNRLPLRWGRAETGANVEDICPKYGISDVTYYRWKSKYGGMKASDLKRVKELEAELSQYKRIYAELARENDAMKDLIAKKL